MHQGCMQTCAHTPWSILTPGKTQCHSLTAVSTCVCLFSSSSILLLSCPPTVHPFIPDPVIFWSISKRRGWGRRRRSGRERGGKNLAPLFITFLVLHPQLPALHPFSLPFVYFGFFAIKKKKKEKHSWRIRFTPTWHFIPHGCTHTHASTWTGKHTTRTGSRCDEHIKKTQGFESDGLL